MGLGKAKGGGQENNLGVRRRRRRKWPVAGRPERAAQVVIWQEVEACAQSRGLNVEGPRRQVQGCLTLSQRAATEDWEEGSDFLGV